MVVFVGCGGQLVFDLLIIEVNMMVILMDDECYVVIFLLVGCVEFIEFLENVFIVLFYYVDMVVVFGQGELFNGMYNLEGFGQLYDLLFE